MEDIEFLVNFVVEYSNWLQKTRFGKEIKLIVFTLGANNIGYVIYPWRKVVVLFCDNEISNHGVLHYVMGLIIKMLLMNKGALSWHKIFGIMVFYFIFNKKIHWKLNKTKIENYIEIWGVFLVLLENPHQV